MTIGKHKLYSHRLFQIYYYYSVLCRRIYTLHRWQDVNQRILGKLQETRHSLTIMISWYHDIMSMISWSVISKLEGTDWDFSGCKLIWAKWTVAGDFEKEQSSGRDASRPLAGRRETSRFMWPKCRRTFGNLISHATFLEVISLFYTRSPSSYS